MRPAPIRRDVRNVVLERGQIVAYNFSGNIARGKIIAVKADAIHIRLIDGGYEAYRNGPIHVSKVKNPTSIMVLQEGDHNA